jgi:SAM-dependent methyltransferase
MLTSEEVATRIAYDAMASTWSAQHDTKGFWAEELKRFYELLPTGRLLEIGAGGGRDAKELVAHGYEYVGTDVSTGLLDVARQQLPGTNFLEQSVYDLAFREPFDGFWASAVLLHIPKDRIGEALQRIRTVMKPGAPGFISMKDGEGEMIQLDKVNGMDMERLMVLWGKDEFADALASNGYEVVDYMFHPMSETTKWHCFFVKVSA